MHIPAKAPDQKCQKPKQSGRRPEWGGPASEPFFTGGLLACSTPRLSDFPRKLGACALGGDPGMEAGGRLFLNLSSARPHVLHHEVPWAAGSSSGGSRQGPPCPGRLRAPAPHQTRQAQAKENLEVRRLASCPGGPGGRYPCRSERGAPQLSLQLEELLSGADPALDSAGKTRRRRASAPSLCAPAPLPWAH